MEMFLERFNTRILTILGMLGSFPSAQLTFGSRRTMSNRS
jgi:hypothetical protein